MAETQQTEEVQQTTYDVMSEAFEELHKDDPVVEETPVEASEEVVDAEPQPEVTTESDVKAPTYQEAQDAQQDAGSGDNIAEEPEKELQAGERVQETKGLASEDAEVYDHLKPKAQERFKHWIDKANSLEHEYNTMLQGNNQLHSIIEGSTTNPQQLGWALEMFKGLNSGDYSTAVQSLKALDQFSDQIAKTLGVHTDGNEKSDYNDFEDLSGAVENLEMSESQACDLVSISSFEELSGGKSGSASNLIAKLKELSDSKPRPPSVKQMNFVKNLANKVDLDEESACKLVEITAYSELSGGRSGTASKLIAILQKKAPKKK